MAFYSEANSRNVTVLVGDDVEVLIGFHTVDTDELSVDLERNARSSGESDVVTDDSCGFCTLTGDCRNSHSCGFRTTDSNDRHEAFFDNGGAGILTEVSVLINLGLDFRRDEVCETAVCDFTGDSRLHEGNLSTCDTDFVKGLGHVRKGLEVSGTGSNLESLVDGLVDSVLFDRTCELDTARLCDFVSERFNIGELVPCVEFNGSVLVLEGHVDLDFVDCVRIGFEAVHDLARIRDIDGIGLAVLLAFEFALSHVAVGFLEVREVIVDFACDELGFVVVGKLVSEILICHNVLILFKNVKV